jgi:uridine kinase
MRQGIGSRARSPDMSPNKIGEDVLTQSFRPFVIGVCGGTASGKTTVCDMLQEKLGKENMATVPSDSFYKTLDPEGLELAHAGMYNFDSPESIAFDECCDSVRQLRHWKDVEIPQYDFSCHARTAETTIVKSREIIMVEGILIFNDERLRSMLDLKIFVDCDADIRLARRVRRDIAERGRALEGVITQYNKFVKPSYNEWVEPSKRFADIIIPNIGDSVNVVAVNLIAEHVKLQLRARAAKAPQGANRRAGSLDVFRSAEIHEPTNREMSAAGLLVQYTTGSLRLPDPSPEGSPRVGPRRRNQSDENLATKSSDEDGGPLRKVVSSQLVVSSSEAGSDQGASSGGKDNASQSNGQPPPTSERLGLVLRDMR